MSSAPEPSAFRSRSDSGDNDVARLRVVDADTYTDWESVYRDNVDRLYRLMYAASRKPTGCRRPHIGGLPDRSRSTSPGLVKGRGAVLSTGHGADRPGVTLAPDPWGVRDLHRSRIRSGRAHGESRPRGSRRRSSAGWQNPRCPSRALSTHPRTAIPRGMLHQGSCSHHGDLVSNAKVLQHRALRMAAKVGLEIEP